MDTKKIVSNFPHQIFERWDVTVHEPANDYEGANEPEYAVRFMLNDGRLITLGLYSKENKFISGWGYPCINTILASPPIHSPGSFFVDEIDVIHTNSRKHNYRTVKFDRRTIGCLNDLLDAFSVITRYFNDGDYDHVHDDMYDFDDATDSAIIVSEVLTGKKSKQRIKSKTFDVSKKTH